MQARRANGVWGYRAALPLLVMLLLSLAALLPLSLSSVLDSVRQPPEGVIFPLSVPIEGEGATTQSRLLASVVGLDEVQGRATLRVSGHRVCATTCPEDTQVVFS